MNDDTQPLAEDVGRLTAGELPRVVLAVAVLDVEGFHLSIELRHDPADGLLVSLTIHGWHGDPSLSEPMSVTPADLPDLAAAVAAAMRTVEDTEPAPARDPPWPPSAASSSRRPGSPAEPGRTSRARPRPGTRRSFPCRW